jgi:hypothetical protein
MGRRTAEERRLNRAQLKQKNEALCFHAPRSTLPDAMAATVADMSKLLRPLAETLGQAALAKVVLRLDSAIYAVLCEIADECPKLLHPAVHKQLRQKLQRLSPEPCLTTSSVTGSHEQEGSAARPVDEQRPQWPRAVVKQVARTSKPAPPAASPSPAAVRSPAPPASPASSAPPQQPGSASAWDYGDLFASLKVDRERG